MKDHFPSTSGVPEIPSGGGHDLLGRRVGPYDIVGRLGAGGMGEVYRARDTTLGRDVAVKVLPAAFAADPDRLARFEREARMLAALNHPHIGAIYGVERIASPSGQPVPALVLELVEGDTLAERIAKASGPERGGLAIDEALAIARQIADALAGAHEKGIVHRDLKPANIKITPAGIVKVLDFGLATASAAFAALELGSSPTMTVGRTEPGAVLGTVTYMSPEQARGQAVDGRTDIWAFGCVVYELLTGRAAFPGATSSDRLVAILEREPDWRALPAAAPAAVGLLLRRCLEKNVTARLSDIREARLDELVPAGRGDRRRTSRLAAVGAAATAALAAASLWVSTSRPAVPVTSPAEYVQLTNFTDNATAPGLSPDGRMVTFLRGGEFFLSTGQIYVKLLPDGEAVRLTSGTDAKYAPVFTPDGSQVAYTSFAPTGAVWSWDTLTVPVLGGPPTRVLPNASGLTWLKDRRVLFAEIKTDLHMGIVTAAENRAASREIYFPPHHRAMAHFASASPDGRSALVVEMDSTHTFNQPCRLLPFDGTSAGRQVGPPGQCTAAAWSPDGRWMYLGITAGGHSHIWRQPFSGGAPEQVTFGPLEEEGIAMAPDGRSIVTSVGMRRSAIWIHDPAGERAITSEGYAAMPRFSRDGTRLFYLSVSELVSGEDGWVPLSAQLRVVDLASGQTETVLPGMSITDYDLSADEQQVAFATQAHGEWEIWVAPLDRRTPPRRLVQSGDRVSFGADGGVVFRSLEKVTSQLVRIAKDGTRPEPLTGLPVLDKIALSPDGRWALVESPPTGLIAVPLEGGRPATICGDCKAAWSRDGRFFYVVLDKSTSPTSPGRTIRVPIPAGKPFPDLPPAGIDLVSAWKDLARAEIIEHGAVSPGPDPATYAFTRTENQRNLFRIPLH